MNLSNCFLTRNQSVEIGKQLLVAYSVEGIEVTLGKYIPRFLFQPLFHHQPYTTVDAVVEYFALAVECYLDYAEGSMLALLDTIGRECVACLMTYFECVYHSAGVASVNYLIVFGVHEAKFFA